MVYVVPFMSVDEVTVALDPTAPQTFDASMLKLDISGVALTVAVMLVAIPQPLS